jgi:hypothetical protein
VEDGVADRRRRRSLRRLAGAERPGEVAEAVDAALAIFDSMPPPGG